MNKVTSKLPVEIVFHPSWWNKNVGITFDKDFFFHPARRVEAEQLMEKVLYERFGKYGLGSEHDVPQPVIGAVHNAAGYLLSEMMGCKVDYSENSSPQVRSADMTTLEINPQDAFQSSAFKQFINLTDKLKEKYGYLKGDVNWNGILNLALDLRGQEIMIDMYENPEQVGRFFRQIATVIETFVNGIQEETGSSSISVNRTVRHLDKPVFLHSECSHTMISVEQYEKTLMQFDIEWSKKYRPFGVHYCGKDPHRYAESFAKIPRLDFLDVGYEGDVKILRNHLPDTFLNIRLSPVKLIDQSVDDIRTEIKKLVSDSGNLDLTGVCCINIDDKVSDDKITTILETVRELRKI
jgi:hypothetical protein